MGKRLDTGSAGAAVDENGTLMAGQGTLDMGARRFGPDVGRFLQRDEYASAVSDLGLPMDPLTQNRYALAGANPISFIETGGHDSAQYWDQNTANDTGREPVDYYPSSSGGGGALSGIEGASGGGGSATGPLRVDLACTGAERDGRRGLRTPLRGDIPVAVRRVVRSSSH